MGKNLGDITLREVGSEALRVLSLTSNTGLGCACCRTPLDPGPPGTCPTCGAPVRVGPPVCLETTLAVLAEKADATGLVFVVVSGPGAPPLIRAFQVVDP